MRSKVTTKQGDAGTTVTIAGEKLPKSHPIFRCCGQLDRVRAETALCRIQLLGSGREDGEALADFLFWLLHVYFLIGTQCSDPKRLRPEFWKEEVAPKHLEKVERFQAGLEAGIELPKAFIVTASTELSAQLDLLCTEIRTLEREIVALKETVPEFESGDMIVLVNRLSDCIYILARHVEDGHHVPVDYGVLEAE